MRKLTPEEKEISRQRNLERMRKWQQEHKEELKEKRRKWLLEKKQNDHEWYEKQINVIEPQQLIIKTRENNSTTVKSYKVYCETEKAFQALCKKYSHLKVQDIVSKALDEFVEKYK